MMGHYCSSLEEHLPESWGSCLPLITQSVDCSLSCADGHVPAIDWFSFFCDIGWPFMLPLAAFLPRFAALCLAPMMCTSCSRIQRYTNGKERDRRSEEARALDALYQNPEDAIQCTHNQSSSRSKGIM